MIVFVHELEGWFLLPTKGVRPEAKLEGNRYLSRTYRRRGIFAGM
jgi:hypothetical protein